MPLSEGTTYTSRAPRYLTQLCTHLRNRGLAEVEIPSESYGVAYSGAATCILRAYPDRLVMTLETNQAGSLGWHQRGLTRDIERFGRRDGLTVTWHSDSSALT